MELVVFISISQAPIQRLGTLFLHASVCRGGGDRGHHDIMPPAKACSLKRRREACCCLNVSKTPGPADVGLLTCLSPLTVDPLLRSAWPSWHLRGRKSWERRRAHKFGGCHGLCWNQEAHLNTTRGTTFHPLFVESAGAWEPHSAGLLRKISRAAAAREGADGEACRNAARVVIACTFRARAVLRRRMELSRASSSWASP